MTRHFLKLPFTILLAFLCGVASADGELIDLTQPDLYQAINVNAANTGPVAMGERFDQIEQMVSERRPLPPELRLIKTVLTKRPNRVLYDWFLAKIGSVPTAHQGNAAEHAALFRAYIENHLPRVFEPHVTPTIFELKRELVSFLTGKAEEFPYRVKEMFDDTKTPPTSEEVHREIQRTFGLRRPIIVSVCAFLMIGTYFAWNLWNQANRDVDARIHQAAPEVPLRDAAPHQPAPPRMEEDPLFREGRDLGRDLAPPPPPAPINPRP